MFGSTALDLVWVAEGRTDASVVLANKPWDTAAGVTNLTGQPHTFSARETVAAAPAITDDLLSLLSDSRC